MNQWNRLELFHECLERIHVNAVIFQEYCSTPLHHQYKKSNKNTFHFQWNFHKYVCNVFLQFPNNSNVIDAAEEIIPCPNVKITKPNLRYDKQKLILRKLHEFFKALVERNCSSSKKIFFIHNFYRIIMKLCQNKVLISNYMVISLWLDRNCGFFDKRYFKLQDFMLTCLANIEARVNSL